MEQKTEKRICQNCKKDFIIEPDDFGFYEKIKVPPPTFCPWCRFIRQMAWRNERNLYKRSCDLCDKNIFSPYPAGIQFPVYCHECWWSDKWEATSYGQKYNFSLPFFKQYKELLDKVPRLGYLHTNVINSDYANLTKDSKNVYLSFSVVRGEDVFYSKAIDDSFDIFDCLNIKNSENCYENIEGDRNYNSQHLLLSRNCADSLYLFDCSNCSDCFMSSNLRNMQFYIRNQKYSKEDYEKEMKKLNSGSQHTRQKLSEEFKDLYSRAIYRFTNSVNVVNSTGNNISNTKNCHNCFDVYDAENMKNSYRAFAIKDAMDIYYGGLGSEIVYECSTAINRSYNVRFSYYVPVQLRNAEYACYCDKSSDIFGCVGVRNKEHAIFNKVYPKKEFFELRDKIIKQMNNLPYLDSKGRVYKYGEFFPYGLSFYAYNENLAQEFEPLDKNAVLEKGYKWRDPEIKSFKATIRVDHIPDNIKDVDEKILNEVLECANKGEHHLCTRAFRITPGELKFYQKHFIPLPNKCPNCRYYDRVDKIPPAYHLYHRTCICELANHGHTEKCPNEFETPYASNRPEKIYCERCYQQE